jgi:two-component system cell cycle response regulator
MHEGMAAGFALGGVALATGATAAAIDAPVLAVVAGLVGAGAAVVGARNAHRAAAANAGRAEAEAQAARLADELAVAIASIPEPLPDPPSAEETLLAALEADALADPETGLFGEPYFEVTVFGRVAAARRHLRPVAVVLVDVATGVRVGEPSPLAPAVVADALRATLREADTTCRLDDGTFGLVLEDTPENGAVWTVERLRRAIAVSHDGVTLRAGVACYPAHAFDAGELRDRAAAALAAAREWRQDRIEVATSSEV